MRSLILTLLCLIALSLARADDTLPQRYAAVDVKTSDALHLESKNDLAGARRGFLDCYDLLMKIRETDPTWEPAVVSRRLDGCLAKIRDLDREIAKVEISPEEQAAVVKLETVNSKDLPAPAATPGQSVVNQPVATRSNPDIIFTKDQRSRTTYPWKTQILTTLFWIGEDSSHASAWNEDWTKSNRGADDPDNRNGFASAAHASSVNPFYVALPFNDLAHPDQAKNWVPHAWQRPAVDGKQISACKDRWVCIKSSSGRICYAQWEDVGPDGNDLAEYVFGNDRPSTGNHAGLDVSPAVAQYLGFDSDTKAVTSWRFVDDEDVPPGQWLKYDEQAVIYTALHQQQRTKD